MAIFNNPRRSPTFSVGALPEKPPAGVGGAELAASGLVTAAGAIPGPVGRIASTLGPLISGWFDQNAALKSAEYAEQNKRAALMGILNLDVSVPQTPLAPETRRGLDLVRKSTPKGLGIASRAFDQTQAVNEADFMTQMAGIGGGSLRERGILGNQRDRAAAVAKQEMLQKIYDSYEQREIDTFMKIGADREADLRLSRQGTITNEMQKALTAGSFLTSDVDTVVMSGFMDSIASSARYEREREDRARAERSSEAARRKDSLGGLIGTGAGAGIGLGLGMLVPGGAIGVPAMMALLGSTGAGAGEKLGRGIAGLS